MKKIAHVGLLSLILMVGCKDKTTRQTQPIQAASGSIKASPVIDLPASVVAWASVGNPDRLIKNIGNIAAKVSPLPSGMLAGVISQSLIQLGFKDTRVLDLGSPAGVLILNPERYGAAVIVAITTKGKTQTLGAIKDTWTQDVEKDGILQLSRNLKNNQAIVDKPRNKTAKQIVFVRFEGPTALVALTKEALTEGSQHLLSLIAQTAMSDGIRSAVRVDHLRAFLQAQLNSLSAMFQREIAKQMKDADQDQATKQMPAMLAWYSDTMQAFIKQTKQVGLALGANPKGTGVRVSIAPENDSFLQKLLAEQKPQQPGSARFLPPNADMAFVANIQYASMKEDLTKLIQGFITPMLDENAKQTYVDLISESMELMGDEIAMSVEFRPNGFRLLEVAQIKDEAKYRKVMEGFGKHAVLWMAGMAGDKTERTLPPPKKLPKHAGVELTQYDININPDSLPPKQAAMANNIYGPDTRVVWGILDKNLLFSMGSDTQQGVQELIDRMKTPTDKGFTKAQPFLATADGLDNKAGAYGFMSLTKLAFKFIQAVTLAQQPSPDKPTIASSSGLFIAFGQQEGQLVSSWYLPTEHLDEIGNLMKSFAK